CGRILARHGVLDDPAWMDRPAVALLSAEERGRLRHDIGHVLLLDARAECWQAEAATDPAVRSEQLKRAARLNTLAESAFGEDGPSRALALQRSEIARIAGRDDEARRLREEAKLLAPRTPLECLWDVIDRLDHPARPDLPAAERERRTILKMLQEISKGDAQNVVNYLLLGTC